MPRSENDGVNDGRLKVRYAVVGLGWISQIVLHSFRNAQNNSQVKVLISSDQPKARGLAARYGIEQIYGYDDFDQAMESGDVDAVYIGLPNHLHREYAERAARAGVHVLCEKPMAVTEQDCEAMIQAARTAGVKLMIAYRLHFEEANLDSIAVLRSGRIGEPRIFHSVFTQQVEEGNIRLAGHHKGGGTLYDIGVYCINAARYLFGEEPLEAWATTANNGENRFARCEEMTVATLRFPGDRMASFVCSFGAASRGSYGVTGTQGSLRLENAYSFTDDMRQQVKTEGESQERVFPKRDQFGAELAYFSQCVLDDREPEPSGEEGVADVRIVRALYDSARRGETVRLQPFERHARPTPAQQVDRPFVGEPELVDAEPASNS
jgi:predicted dehydrogenase